MDGLEPNLQINIGGWKKSSSTNQATTKSSSLTRAYGAKMIKATNFTSLEKFVIK